MDNSFARFELVKKLRDGNEGYANLMRIKESGELVTVKFIQRGPKVDTRVEREIMCHRVLSHVNIIRLLEVFLTPEYLGIVMEYASDGELFDYVASKGRMVEAEARYFFQQLICGVEYCHKMGVVHRDLKLENTLLHIEGDHAPRIKICDFGYSKSMRYHSLPNSTVGTPAYIAPEVFTIVLGEGAYSGETADVWSCGVLLYVMLFGCYPFGDPQQSETPITAVITRITRAEYNIPPGENISDDCRDLLAKIFVPRPSERISISGIRSHAFFTKDLPWEFQVNAPLSIPPRQTDEETLNIITAARSPDQSMGVPLWANDIVPMMDIEPQLMSHMTTDLGSSISVDSEWDLTANELQEMMSYIERGVVTSSAHHTAPQPRTVGMPQGMCGMSLAPRPAAQGSPTPRPSDNSMARHGNGSQHMDLAQGTGFYWHAGQSQQMHPQAPAGLGVPLQQPPSGLGGGLGLGGPGLPKSRSQGRR